MNRLHQILEYYNYHNCYFEFYYRYLDMKNYVAELQGNKPVFDINEEEKKIKIKNIGLNKNPTPSGSTPQPIDNSKINSSQLKYDVAQLGSSFIKYDNTYNDKVNLLEYKTDNFNIQIFDSSNYQNNVDYSVKNNLAIVDTSGCLDKIRKYLILTNKK